MVRVFLTSVLAIAVLSATARAERIYVGWQNPKILGAYDLADGSLIGPPPTFDTIPAKPMGVAVSPLDGNIYVGIDSSSGPSIVSYNPTTGAVVNSNVASLSSAVFGLCFDSSGNMYAGQKHGDYPKYIAKLSPNGSGGFSVDGNWGSPPTSGSSLEVNDMTIYNGKLYATRYYGVSVYDLSGVNEGVGGWFAEDPNNCLGLAFNTDMASNATMYTVDLGSKSVMAWDGPEYDSAHSENLGTFDNAIQDIDYYDGYLYVKSQRNDNREFGIFRYDLNAADPEWEYFISTPNDGGSGYLDIAPDPVPEPGTLALLATGLIGLLAYAWRKRK